MRPRATRRLALLILAVALAAPMPLAAKPPLRDVSEIDDALMAVAIADEIRTRCDSIDARLVRAYVTLSGLKSRARDLGYSEAEIEAYVTSKSEKARMRAKAEAWLAAQGVDAARTDDLCAFGRGAIARDGDAIGRLLR